MLQTTVRGSVGKKKITELQTRGGKCWHAFTAKQPGQKGFFFSLSFSPCSVFELWHLHRAWCEQIIHVSPYTPVLHVTLLFVHSLIMLSGISIFTFEVLLVNLLNSVRFTEVIKRYYSSGLGCWTTSGIILVFFGFGFWLSHQAAFSKGQCPGVNPIWWNNNIYKRNIWLHVTFPSFKKMTSKWVRCLKKISYLSDANNQCSAFFSFISNNVNRRGVPCNVHAKRFLLMHFWPTRLTACKKLNGTLILRLCV